MSLNDAVQYASSLPVQKGASQLKVRHLPNGRWLSARNHYVGDTVQIIKSDRTSGRNPRPIQMQQYVAASVVLHCLNGWSYLSQAIGSLLDGEIANAVHLAYYAELRATMSFLASEGIGVFSQTHFWFDNSGKCHEIHGKPTHRVVWELIQNWANEPVRASRLLELMRYDNANFLQWISAAGIAVGAPSVTGLAQQWLKTWSIDLAMLTDDRELRNLASYRPQGIDSIQYHGGLKHFTEAVVSVWKACEPSESEPFLLLDSNLLRSSLQKVYEIRTGTLAMGPTYAIFIQKILQDLGRFPNARLEQFLSRQDTPGDHFLLSEATKPGSIGNGILQPLPIISRAVLLLRLASAASKEIMTVASIDSSEIEFCWRSLGQQTGLWESGTPPSQMADLWADTRDAIAAVELWLEDSLETITPFRARQDLSAEFWHMRQFQRAGLWALGL